MADLEAEERPVSTPAVTRLGLYAYVLAAIVIIADQVSKYWVLDVVGLARRGSVPVLPFFQLTMVCNEGVSFGLLKAGGGGRWLLVLFALVVVGALVAWARTVTRPIAALALGLVIGGAIGNNLIDRIRFGCVADFLDFHVLMFPWVFNLADSAISVGVALLLLDSYLSSRRPAA